MGKDFDKSVRNVSERLGQDKAYIIDSTRAREELGWTTDISLEEGVQGVVKWVEEYWDEIQAQPLEYVHKP
jgi:dTDP-glucose 4,6-dehydratase